ncbi:MAG: UDP-N-acetylglucosamine 2-epimerase (non-hydrolyzing) [Deltaproteobacteria bacterium]|nr:MAG: UDP-N-acetylglucosamine 2-epimerase (non-hydrolyzing) [Deltaproteobacteria bacterium]
MKKILFCFGTRPETIKMAPIIKECPKHGFEPIVCLTGQHREMLLPFVELFDLPVHENLDVMTEGQGLYQITSSVIQGMEKIFKKYNPDVTLVQGDTTTTFSCGLGSFYAKVPVGHVEAGLRTNNLMSPFPEEGNRQMTSRITTYHFVPTEVSKANLEREGITENIFITGNTSVDSIRLTLDKIPTEESGDMKTILMTCHRRENFGKPHEEIFSAVLDLVEKHKNYKVKFPVHLNPLVKETAHRILGNHDRIDLVEPMDYITFVKEMRNCDFILSDSGGVQEEAPYIGKPVLVLRENTERPEGVDAGTSVLVGTSREKITEVANRLIEDRNYYRSFQEIRNPYGDGFASKKILTALEKL